jgi:site-specific DNA-methyltransferase (adenine-specific)
VTRIEHIGDATLYLGDCREAMRGISDGSVHLLWTDPPYGHANHDGDFNARLNDFRGIAGKPIANDTPDAMRDVVDAMLSEAVRVLDPDCCCCCCCCGGGGGPKPTFAWVAQRMDAKGLTFFHSVIWDKLNPGLGWRYRRQHEMVMVAHRETATLRWQDEAKAVRNIYSEMPPRNRLHPNEKPLGMVAHFINNHTYPGDVVLDPFMGSGTTGVAAVRMGRKFIGIELDPEHFETALRRIREAQAADLFISKPEPPKQEALL